jgi:RNA polymerase sigma factor (sigma-70 family)
MPPSTTSRFVRCSTAACWRTDTSATADRRVEDLLRELAPQVLAVIVRRYEDFGSCEDAVQEALLAASTQWPTDGVPSNPTGWLVTVSSRRWIETWRRDVARRRREDALSATEPDEVDPPPARDDSLTLLFLCCHPALTPASQVALTLRAVGGLTTAEIARALLVPVSTVAQRISRAKASIKDAGAQFTTPDDSERPGRLAAVLRVLYLIFNEGYTASSGPSLNRVELTAEAIRLTRQLHAELPDDGEVAGLLALMLLTDARRVARTGADGGLVPLPEQDRSRWNRDAIAEGCALIEKSMSTAVIGAFQIQAAIAAVHDEAETAQDTDWPQILGLYDLLTILSPGPMVTLNRVVALAMVRGPVAGLAALEAAEDDSALAGHHRIAAVRAHLLDLTGDREAAREQYRQAARTTLNVAEQRYLESRADASRRPSSTSG